MRQMTHRLVKLKNLIAAFVANPKFKWYQRAVWAISLSWALYLGIESIPYYTQIGAGKHAFESAHYAEAEARFKAALVETRSFSPTSP